MTLLIFYIFDAACLVSSETKKSRISDKENAFCGLENEGVFEELLRTSGIVLKAGEGQNEIGMSLMFALSDLDQNLQGWLVQSNDVFYLQNKSAWASLFQSSSKPSFGLFVKYLLFLLNSMHHLNSLYHLFGCIPVKSKDFWKIIGGT